MSKLTRRKFLFTSSAVVAGAVLTACQPPAATPTEAPVVEEPVAEEPTKEPEKPVEEPTAAPEEPAAPAKPQPWPLGDVPRNRTLIYQYGAPAAGQFNPFASAYNHQIGNAILYEPAAFYSALGDKTYMWLAESYQYNDDATEVTIVFRKGIMWSDGTPFTAKDAAWSMNTLKTVDGLNRAGTYKAELDVAEAVDDITLKLKLTQPDWRFFFKSLTFRYDLGDDTAIQAEHIWGGVAPEEIVNQSIFDAAKGWPVSTGPYGVSDSTDQYTLYDLRESWWAVETGFLDHYPEVVRIRMEAFTNDTIAGQKLINDELDQPLDARPLVIASLLVQSEHLTSWTGRKPPFGYVDWWPISVQFCTKKAPWDNPKVRWAVAYALNQDQLVTVGWGGAGKVANTPFPEYPALDKYVAGIPDLLEKYNVLEFNLEKSAALMTEAGFTKDDEGFWVDAQGVRPDSDLYAAVPLFGDLAPLIAEQLRNGGFACEHKAPPDVWAAKVDGRASMFLFGHGGATIDPLDTFLLYQSANAAEMGQQSWGNITRWGPPEFEALRDEMNVTPMDDPKMTELFKSMMEIYYTELPDCPIVQWYHRIPLNTTFWQNWPDENNPYMNSALWHLTMLQVIYGLKAAQA